ncbi:MAG: hypothetical protein NVS9B1_21860 [Candidatus Dormibacteraceae bacterium]
MFGKFQGARHASVRVFTVAAFLLSAVATLATPTVAAAAGTATLTPSTWYFVAPGSHIFTFAVAAGTSADLPIASLAGLNPAQFSVSSGCPGFVTTSCIINVTFTPTGTSSVSALLQVSYKDAAGAAQVATATLTGGPVGSAPTATTLVVTSSSSAAGTAGVFVTATLTDSAGAPIANAAVMFTACRVGKAGEHGDGSPHEDSQPASCTSGMGTTNAQGNAGAQLQLGPGAYSLTAKFAGDSLHLASSAVAPLAVSKGREHDGEKADQDEGGASD